MLGASAAAAGCEASTNPSSEQPTDLPAAAHAPSSLSARFNAVSELHNNAVFVRQAVKYGFFNFSDFSAEGPTAQTADSDNTDFSSTVLAKLYKIRDNHYAASRFSDVKRAIVKVSRELLKDFADAEDWNAVSCIVLHAPCADPKMRAFHTLLKDKLKLRIYPGVLDVLLEEGDIVYVLLGADGAKSGCIVEEALARCEEDPDDRAVIHRRLMMVAWCRDDGLSSVVSDYAEQVEHRKFYLNARGQWDCRPETIPLCSHPTLVLNDFSLSGKLFPQLPRTFAGSIATFVERRTHRFPCWPQGRDNKRYFLASDASWEVLEANDKHFPVKDKVEGRVGSSIKEYVRQSKTESRSCFRRCVWLHKGSSVERTAAMLSLPSFCELFGTSCLAICIYLRGCEVFETATPGQRKYLLTGNHKEYCGVVDVLLKTMRRLWPTLRLHPTSPPENELQFVTVMVDQCESLPGLVYLMAHMKGSDDVKAQFLTSQVSYIVSSSDDVEVGESFPGAFVADVACV